ncbi:MAG TPA: DUF1552 domain-containing protein [Polyangiaceae bacterium]
MSQKALRRRLFLSALGAALVGVGQRPAAAQSGAAGATRAPANTADPLRFVGVYTPHGCAYELYKPREGFDIAFENCTLAPFDDPAAFGKSFKDRLLVLDHVDLSAGMEAGTVGHDAPRVILTGSGAHGKNASIDQYLAAEQGLGRNTPVTSLVLGIGDPRSDIGSNISYAAGGTPVPKLIDPSEVFDELFGKPLTGKARAALAEERRQGRSVLDFLQGDLAQLRKQSPASERTKLEQHASALREIEKRLSGVRPACEPPFPRSSTSFARFKAHAGGEVNFDQVTNVMVDLLARALACDLTRFSTLFLADLSRSKLYPELPDDIHGGVAHRYHAKDGKSPGNPETWQRLALQNRYSYSKLARLMQRLDEAGVLDHTLIYASSDMGDPARHSSRHVPTLLLGGAGGQFQMGRYLELDPARGTPNNRVLVSICQAFGVNAPRFGTGSSAVVSGRLEQLHA